MIIGFILLLLQVNFFDTCRYYDLTDTIQSKVDRYEKVSFLARSAVYLLSPVYLFSSKISDMCRYDLTDAKQSC